MDPNKRPDDMVRITTPELAQAFIDEQVAAVREQIGDKKVLLALSGGVDSSGNVIAPNENQTKLNHELFRKTIDGYSFINDTTCRYECTLSESELAGEYISEIGLYDSAGDIVCIKTFTKKGKDGDIEMTYTLDDVF